MVQTQVLPYLRELLRGNDLNAETQRNKEDRASRNAAIGEDADENNRPPRQPMAATPPNSGRELKISLLTFEPEMKQKWTAEQIVAEREKLAVEGIDWHCLPYHKRFSAIATAWDIFCGAVRVWRLNLRERYDILHCRVHVPGMMALLASFFSMHKPKILFDIRGFFPEEFVDAGLWKKDSAVFKAAKTVERRIVKKAAGFVVLTNKAREIMFSDAKGSTAEGWTDSRGRPVEVIPCCIDQKRFLAANEENRELIRRELSINDRPVLAYVGSFGGWYMTEETAEMFAVARKNDPRRFALILTQSPREMIEPLLLKSGYAAEDHYINRVAAADIPKYLSAADVAVSFIKPSYSKKSSSPTKNAEYLACGLPIIANPGVGDVDELINEHAVGALIDGFDEKSYLAALEKIEELGDINQHCRNIAVSELDLENVGGKRYRRLYERILGRE